jgi:hypothetical protein
MCNMSLLREFRVRASVQTARKLPATKSRSQMRGPPMPSACARRRARPDQLDGRGRPTPLIELVIFDNEGPLAYAEGGH